MSNELAKAVVRALEGDHAGEEMEVLFNPTEYSIEYGASYQESAPPGLSNPVLQFVNGSAQTLTMELLFDTYTNGGGTDVSKQTRKFTDLLAIDGKLHAPPRVEFAWGVLVFKAVLERASQRFTMFRSDGTPVRATLNVTFKQSRSIAEQLEQPRRNSADRTKRRVFEVHDSLWLMANREYGAPRYWRLIARHNRIDDVRTLETGTVLLLPPLTEKEDRRGA